MGEQKANQRALKKGPKQPKLFMGSAPSVPAAGDAETKKRERGDLWEREKTGTSEKPSTAKRRAELPPESPSEARSRIKEGSSAGAAALCSPPVGNEARLRPAPAGTAVGPICRHYTIRRRQWGETRKRPVFGRMKTKAKQPKAKLGPSSL